MWFKTLDKLKIKFIKHTSENNIEIIFLRLQKRFSVLAETFTLITHYWCLHQRCIRHKSFYIWKACFILLLIVLKNIAMWRFSDYYYFKKSTSSCGCNDLIVIVKIHFAMRSLNEYDLWNRCTHVAWYDECSMTHIICSGHFWKTGIWLWLPRKQKYRYSVFPTH